MARGPRHALGGPDLDDPAEVHHGHAVAHQLHHLQIVRDEEIRQTQTRLQIAQQVDDLRLDRDVERAGGLVGHDEARADGEHARDAHATLLAAGQLVREARELGRLQIHLIQQLGGPPRHLRLLQPMMQRDRLTQDVADAHARIERGVEILKDHLHLLAQWPQRARRQRGDVVAVEHDAPGRRRRDAQDDAADRRLAAAGLADEPERLVLREAEADAVDRRDGACPPVQRGEHAGARLVLLAEVRDLEERPSHRAPRRGGDGSACGGPPRPWPAPAPRPCSAPESRR